MNLNTSEEIKHSKESDDPSSPADENSEIKEKHEINSEVFHKDEKGESLNMASNGQTENLNNEQEEQVDNEGKIQKSEEENVPDQAVDVVDEDLENDKIELNDEKIVWNQDIPNANSEQVEDSSAQVVHNEVESPISEVNEEEENIDTKILNHLKSGHEWQSNEINSNIVDNTNMEAKETPKNSEDDGENQYVYQPSPDKNAGIQQDGGAFKNLANSSRKQNLPKRVLRDRKSRGARGADSMSKCHICEKNSLRWTLIPCTKGADDWDIYFLKHMN